MSSATRSTSLSPHDFRLLDQWGRQLQEVFGETPYLVGSVARASRDPRDVDVRMLLPEGAEWIARTRLRLLHVNLSVTMWGRHVTGLPIDFQFQPPDDFHTYDDERRGALGISTRVAVREAEEISQYDDPDNEPRGSAEDSPFAASQGEREGSNQ